MIPLDRSSCKSRSSIYTCQVYYFHAHLPCHISVPSCSCIFPSCAGMKEHEDSRSSSLSVAEIMPIFSLLPAIAYITTANVMA